MSRESEEVRVRFLPFDIVVKVPKGTTVLEAAIKANIGIRSVCSGKGLCGKCKVIVRKGAVKSRETDLLSAKEKAEGYVLACLAKVVEDVEIESPPESIIGKPKLLASVKLPTITPKPMIKSLSTSIDEISKLPYNCNTDIKYKLAELGNRGVERVVAIINSARGKIVDVSERDRGIYGLAVDIGTTKIVVALVDIARGQVLETVSEFNRQLLYGEDIVSRIRYALEKREGLKELQKAAVNTINMLANELYKKYNISKDDVFMVTAAGNTAMTYLFVGINPYQLIKSFKEPVNVPRNPYWLEARDLGLDVNRNADVYVLPCAGRFLGGDVIGDIITAGINFSSEPSLLIDIGTNTEVVIGCKNWFLGTTAPAGPAFEGWGLTSGVRAIAGAIESVTIDPRTCKAIYSTIDNAKPIGICGSGYIDLVAQLFVNGLLDAYTDVANALAKLCKDCECPYIRRGERGWEYVVVPAKESGTGKDIVITEKDIFNIIDSKSSVCASVAILLKAMRLSVYDIKKVYVCGAFGSYLNLNSAMTIGMIPEFPNASIEYIGNGSLGGAILTLLSEDYRVEAERVAKLMASIELLLDPNFMDEYSAGFVLPGNRELFPTWYEASRKIKPWRPSKE